MKYKTPKELEKVPIIAGFELKKVIFIIIAAMSFVFLVKTSFLMSLFLPMLVALYIYISKKFSKDGELVCYLKYLSSPKTSSFNKTIEQLINSKQTINK